MFKLNKEERVKFDNRVKTKINIIVMEIYRFSGSVNKSNKKRA
jgi:hypothetical protein